VKAFNAFNQVVKACYGHKLDPTYKATISIFKECYSELQISITPKVHAIIYHIIDFCQPCGEGLGQWSEQASENVHSDFNATWLKYKVPENHPRYGLQLLRAVQEYNAQHI
jgi:hypothetical protein